MALDMRPFTVMLFKDLKTKRFTVKYVEEEVNAYMIVCLTVCLCVCVFLCVCLCVGVFVECGVAAAGGGGGGGEGGVQGVRIPYPCLECLPYVSSTITIHSPTNTLSLTASNLELAGQQRASLAPSVTSGWPPLHTVPRSSRHSCLPAVHWAEVGRCGAGAQSYLLLINIWLKETVHITVLEYKQIMLYRLREATTSKFYGCL